MLPEILLVLFLLGIPKKTSVLGTSSVFEKPLASHTISLNNRYGNDFVNDVFKDNILLVLRYAEGQVKSKNEISWPEVEKPFHYEFTLNSGEAFAFHEGILPAYAGKVVKTTNAHFNWADGFKSDGYLMGDGVCHLASLIYWVAKDAGLDAYAPSNHNFAVINEIPKKFGVAIFYNPNAKEGSAWQNLYITNNKEKPVVFAFDYQNSNLTLNILEK